MGRSVETIYALAEYQGKDVHSSTGLTIDLHRLRAMSQVDYRIMEHTSRCGIWPFRRPRTYYVVYRPITAEEFMRGAHSLAYILPSDVPVTVNRWYALAWPHRLSEREAYQVLNNIMLNYSRG